MAYSLTNGFFNNENEFFSKENFNSIDLQELEGFNITILKDLKELGLFSLFKEFKEFKELGSYKALKELSSFKEFKEFNFNFSFNSSSLFPIYLEDREFREASAFNNFKELSFLSYYKDFKLLLCSYCHLAIHPTNIRGHLLKHCSLLKGKDEKEAFITRALNVIEGLEVSSLKESHFLILLFSSFFPLPPFKELEVKEDLYSCFASSTCSSLKSSLYHIKRHLREEHKSLFSNKDIKVDLYYKVISKGQSLEGTRFFFPLYNKEGRIEESVILPSSLSIRVNSVISIIEGDEDNRDEHLDSLSLASSFLKEFKVKEEEFKEGRVPFSLSSQEKYSTFQMKTRYLEFITSKDKQVLFKLVAPLSKEEKVLEVLVNHLKEMLYLSLEKSLFLNKVHLNLLNSFQLHVIKNKGFKPLLNSSSRVSYFTFFSLFLLFLLRSFNNNSYKDLKLYSLSSTLTRNLEELTRLAMLKLEEEEEEITKGAKSIKKGLNSIRKSLNYKLNRLRVKNIYEEEDEESDKEGEDLENEVEEEEDEEEDDVLSLASSSSLESLESSDSISSTSILKKVSSLSKEDNNVSILIKKKLLGVLITLFKQETNLYLFNSPIHSFFASKGLRVDLSIRDTLDFSQYYSKFIYCAQLLVIEYSFSYVISKDDSSSLTSIIREFMSSSFNNSVATPLGEILNNRSYCFKVNKELSSSLSVIISSIIKETLSYKKVTISIDDLRLLFKEVILSTSTILREKLLLNIPLKEYKHITLEDFSNVEDNSITTPYKCFKDFHSSSLKNDNLVRDYLLKTPSLRSKIFNLKDGKLAINPLKVKAYLRDVREFLKLSLLIIHLTSGLPLRGTELTTLRFLNSYKERREMFLDKGSNLFVLNISYSKGREYREKEGSNVRYLCKSASKIFLLYITLVFPFIDFLKIASSSSSSIYKKSLPLSCYFFYIDKHLLSSRDLSIKLNTFSNLILGQRLNIQAYRQLIVAVVRVFMKEDLDEETLTLKDSLSNDPFKDIKALQMNHSSSIEDLHYGRSSTTFLNVKEGIQKRYLEFCLRFFTYFQISNLQVSSNPFISLLKEKDLVDKSFKEVKNNTLALRFSKEPSLSSISTSRKHARNKSSIASALQNDIVVKKVRLGDLNEISSTSTSTSSTLSTLLQEFLNSPRATFKIREQELLIRAILLKVPYILAILPTNSGKSLSYLLTSSLSTSRISIIILPLVGLKQDILRRAKEFNIPSTIYEEERGVSTLTLVSIESIVRGDFIFLLKRLIEEERLDRIIIDECHLLLTSANYRPIMYRFIEILLLPTQFVFLTGTLPSTFKKELKETLKLESSLSVIRAPTSRGDISYKTKVYSSPSSEGQLEEVRSYIESYKLKLSSLEDKILIFCPTIPSIIELGDALMCPIYDSSLEKNKKEEVLSNFLSKNDAYNKVLVSSSALEEGLDYPSIRLVAYKDFSYSFLSFLQGSSRGGRDGRKSTSLFFYNKREEEERDSDSLDKSTLRKYLREGVCKRRVINLFLDNSLIDKCLKEEEPCSCCLSRHAILSSTISTIKSSSIYIERNREAFKERIRELSSLCIYCSLLSRPKGHSSYNCSLSRDIHKLEWPISCDIKERKKVLLKDDSCCFTCFLPTTICSTMKREERGKLVCFNLKLITRIISLFFHMQEDLKIKERFNIASSLTSYKALFPFFFTKVFLKDLNTEGILGVKVLLEILDEINK